MAIGGRKPKSVELKLVTGNPGRYPLLPEVKPKFRDHPLLPPRKLTKPQQTLWDRFINTAWWLADHDAPKAFIWVCLQAEYNKAPNKMIAARIAQLRVTGSELGFDPGSRTRLGATGGEKEKDSTEAFFDQ